MKKIIIATGVALTVLMNNVQAQVTELDLREKATFGLKGGFNYSNVYDSQGEEFDADAKFGLAAGISVAIPIGKYIGVQPELLLSQRGFQGSGQILGSPYYFTRTTTFLDIPLLFALKPSKYITIVAGPQFSFLLNQRDVFENANTTFAQEQEFENDDARRNLLCFTGGLDFNLRHLVLGGRVGWDVQSNHNNGSSSTPRYKNVWYQATIGFRF